MSPITPADLKATLLSAGSALCDKFVACLSEAKLFYQWFAYVYNEDGSFSDDFKSDICSLPCIPGVGPLVFGAPVISASLGDYDDRIVVSWHAVPSATAYQVFYSTTNANPVYLGETANLSYTHTGVTVNTDYNYWVKAKKADGTLSDYSNMATGRADNDVPDVTVPVVSVTGNGTYQPVLTWAPVSGATGYDIYYSTTYANFAYAVILQSISHNGIGNVSYLVPGSILRTGQGYVYFWVRAKNASATSAPSSVVGVQKMP